MTVLRVATYNLYLGADLAQLFGVTDLERLAGRVGVVRGQLEATRFEERARAVATLLARERPDLVGLQEVSRWVVAPIGADGAVGEERVLVDFLPTLLDALGQAGCPYDAHVVCASFSGAMPVSEAEWMSLTGANVTLLRRGAPARVVGQDTAPYRDSYEVVTGLNGVSFPVVRSWGRLDVEVDGHPVRFVNTHTEAYDGRTRDAQRDELLSRVGGAGSPVVVVGDLNAGPGDVGIPDPWVDAWSRGEGDGFTHGQDPELANPTSRLSERIDYVWVRDVTVLGCRVVGDRPEDRTDPAHLWPSDHACVVADLELA